MIAFFMTRVIAPGYVRLHELRGKYFGATAKASNPGSKIPAHATSR